MLLDHPGEAAMHVLVRAVFGDVPRLAVLDSAQDPDQQVDEQSFRDDLAATRAAPLLPVELVQDVLDLQVVPVVRRELNAVAAGENLREFGCARRDLLKVALRHGHDPTLAVVLEGQGVHGK